VLENIGYFYDYLDEFNLGVTKRAAYDLADVWDEFSELPEGHALTAAEASRLAGVMDDLRRTLFAEADGNLAYIVGEKRLDTVKLVSDVSSLFARGVFEVLPEVAQYDFEEAGKCVAFERSTAAAFHLLRGTEDVLRAFYCGIVRQRRVSPLVWGPMVDGLRARRSPPPAELLRNLDNSRLSFRNPTQHPEKIYDIDEVQDLFGLSVDVVNRMAKIQRLG